MYNDQNKKPLYVEYCPDTAEQGTRLDKLKPGNRMAGAADVCRQLGIRARIVDEYENYEGHIMEDGGIDWARKKY